MSVPFFAKANGDWLRSTPALGRQCLDVAKMRGLLVCMTARTGTTRLNVDFVKQFDTPLPEFRFVRFPFVEGNNLYVQAGADLF